VLVATVACWAAVAAVWAAAAVHGRVAALRSAGALGRVDALARRRARGAPIVWLLILVGVLSAAGSLANDQLLATITIGPTPLQPVGVGLLALSAAFAIWARLTLGASWSVGPRVVGDSRLRTTGPYAVTRHPIYTGILGMLIGTALVSGIAASLIVVVAGVVAIEIKIRREEAQLMATFPDEYPMYRRRVPRLVPGLAANGR